MAPKIKNDSINILPDAPLPLTGNEAVAIEVTVQQDVYAKYKTQLKNISLLSLNLTDSYFTLGVPSLNLPNACQLVIGAGLRLGTEPKAKTLSLQSIPEGTVLGKLHKDGVPEPLRSNDLMTLLTGEKGIFHSLTLSDSLYVGDPRERNLFFIGNTIQSSADLLINPIGEWIHLGNSARTVPVSEGSLMVHTVDGYERVLTVRDLDNLMSKDDPVDVKLPDTCYPTDLYAPSTFNTHIDFEKSGVSLVTQIYNGPVQVHLTETTKKLPFRAVLRAVSPASKVNVFVFDGEDKLILERINVDPYTTPFDYTWFTPSADCYKFLVTPYERGDLLQNIYWQFSTEAEIAASRYMFRPTEMDHCFDEHVMGDFRVTHGGNDKKIIAFEFQSSQPEGDTCILFIDGITDPNLVFTLYYWKPGALLLPTRVFRGLTSINDTLDFEILLGGPDTNLQDDRHCFALVADVTCPVMTSKVEFVIHPTPNVLGVVGSHQLNRPMINFDEWVSNNRPKEALLGYLKGTEKKFFGLSLTQDNLVGGFQINVASPCDIHVSVFDAWSGVLIDSCNEDLRTVVIPEDSLPGHYVVVVQPATNRDSGPISLFFRPNKGRVEVYHTTSRKITGFTHDFGTVDHGSVKDVTLNASEGFRKFFKFTSLTDAGPSLLTIYMGGVKVPTYNQTVRVALWQRSPDTEEKYHRLPDVAENVLYEYLLDGVTFRLDSSAGTDGEFIFSIEADRNDIDWQSGEVSFSIDNAMAGVS